MKTCLIVFLAIIGLIGVLLIGSYKEVSKLTRPQDYENISDWFSDMARFEWRYVMPGVE